MANNLFVSYDLMAPGQHYDRVTEEIKKLGAWAKVHYSLFYVNSPYTVEQAAKHVWASMDANDKLIVIDANANNFYAFNLDPVVLKHMQDQWYK